MNKPRLFAVPNDGGYWSCNKCDNTKLEHSQVVKIQGPDWGVTCLACVPQESQNTIIEPFTAWEALTPEERRSNGKA